MESRVKAARNSLKRTRQWPPPSHQNNVVNQSQPPLTPEIRPSSGPATIFQYVPPFSTIQNYSSTRPFSGRVPLRTHHTTFRVICRCPTAAAYGREVLLSASIYTSSRHFVIVLSYAARQMVSTIHIHDNQFLTMVRGFSLHSESR